MIIRVADGLPGERGYLARHADDRRTAGHIGCQVDIEHCRAHIVNQWGPNRRLRVEDEDAFVFFGDAQLFLGAEHVPVHNPPDGAAFECHLRTVVLVAIVEGDPLQGKGRFEVQAADVLTDEGEEVGRAGDNRLDLWCAVLHVGQHQPVRVGMRLDGQDMPYDDLVAVPGQLCTLNAQVVDPGDFQPSQCQSLGQFIQWERDVYVIFEPGNGYFHCRVTPWVSILAVGVSVS